MDSKKQKFINTLLNTTPDMMAILDKDGKILECNSRFADSSRYEKKELIGMIGPIDLISDKDRQRAVSAFSEVIQKGIKLNVKLEARRKNGETYPSIWSGAKLVTENGNLEGYLVTGKDLSEIQSLQNEIQKTKEESSKERLALVGQLTSRLAHDIKNPLNVIKMAIHVTQNNKDKLVSDKVIQTNLQSIQNNVEKISNQVRFVLDFVRERPLHLEQISVLSCLKESIKDVYVPKNVKLEIPKDDLDILGDSLQIHTVFVNLFCNSIESFEGKNGVISVRFLDDKNYAVIQIQDSGPGIPEDILGRLFEPLVTRKTYGTGLGLVSCKSIIENHGGLIYATNNPTTFTIKLPKIDKE